MLFIASCQSQGGHRGMFSPNKFQEKRSPLQNAQYQDPIDSQAMSEVDQEINNFRFKDDFSRTPVSHINFDDMPSKVIIDEVDVKQSNIYELPKSQIKAKHKKKSSVKKQYRKKAKITKSSYKKEHFPNLADAPDRQSTTVQNQQYAQEKAAQARDMEQRSQKVRMPSKKAHEGIQAASNNAPPADKEEQLNEKLQRLQSHHQTVVQNAKQGAQQSNINNQQSQQSSQQVTSPPVQLKVISPANNQPNKLVPQQASSVPIPQIPNIAEGSQSGDSGSSANNMQLSGVVPVPGPNQSSQVKQSSLASGSAQAQPTTAASSSSPNAPVAPMSSGTQISSVAQQSSLSVPSAIPNTNAQTQNLKESGIPPAPDTSDGFFEKIDDEMKNILHPKSPANSEKGKKKISIKDDMSLEVKDKNSNPDWQASSWNDPKQDVVIQSDKSPKSNQDSNK